MADHWHFLNDVELYATLDPGVVSCLQNRHMKLLFPILTVILLTSSITCKKDKQALKACGIDNPLQNIPWLKNILDSLTNKTVGGSITLMKYGEQNYFALQPITMSCRYCFIYTCDGILLKSPDNDALLQTLQISNDVSRQVVYTYGLQ